MRRYNQLVTTVARDTLGHWKQNLVTDGIISFTDCYEVVTNSKRDPLMFTYCAQLHLSLDSADLYIIDGGADPGEEDDEDGFISVDIWASTSKFPQIWSDIAMDLRDIIRHEVEHLTQSGINKVQGKDFDDDAMLRSMIADELLPNSTYYMLPAEVDAMLHGLWFKTKKSRRPWREVVFSYLNTLNLTQSDYDAIATLWNKRTKALSLPSLK